MNSPDVILGMVKTEAVERHSAQTTTDDIDLVIRILSHGDHNCADHQCFSVNEIAEAVNYAAGAVNVQ